MFFMFQLSSVKKSAAVLGAICISALPASSATLPAVLGPQQEITSEQVRALSALRPFFWSPEAEFQDLGTLPRGVISGQATSIGSNNRLVGLLVGRGLNSPFQWDPEGGLSIIPSEGENSDSVLAVGVDGKTLVGSRGTQQDARAIVWINGEALDLNTLIDDLPEGLVLNEAHMVSDTGHILGVGTQVIAGKSQTVLFSWTPGQPIELIGEIDAASAASVHKLSPNGNLIGQARHQGKQFGFIDRIGSLGQAPRLLQVSDGASTEAHGVNTRGDVVGAAGTGPQAAYIWPAGGGEGINLNSRLAEPAPEGFHLVRAGAISPTGEIAAYGVSASGGVNLVLLKPLGGPNPTYEMRELGEVLQNVERHPLPNLSIADNGNIAGSCAPFAQACPAFSNLSPEELALLYGVTNVFDPAGSNGLALPLTTAFAAPPAGGGGGGPAGGGITVARPPVTPGTPFFPTTTSTPSPAPPPPGTSTLAPVPLPAAIWGLLIALMMLVRPRRWRQT